MSEGDSSAEGAREDEMGVVKKCDCCGHEYTAAEWERLPERTYWGRIFGRAGCVLEQRRCQCGSHIARQVKP